MSQVVGWVIYYADGSTFDSDQVPEDAPSSGVQIIVEYRDNSSWQYRYGADYYHWNGTSWVESNQPTDGAIVGSQMEDSAWHKLLEEVVTSWR